MASASFRLEHFTQADFADYLRLTGDDTVMSMITGRALDEVESRTNFDRILQQNKVNPKFGNFKILQAGTDEFIGLAKLVLLNSSDSEVEIGFMLLPKFWGKGIASSATKQLIEVAKSEQQLQKIKAVLDPQNKASRKILVNQGFVSEFLGEIDDLPGEVMQLLL